MTFEAGDRVVVIEPAGALPAPFQTTNLPLGERGTVIEARLTSWTARTVGRTRLGASPDSAAVWELRVRWDSFPERKIYSYQVRRLNLIDRIGELDG